MILFHRIFIVISLVSALFQKKKRSFFVFFLQFIALIGWLWYTFIFLYFFCFISINFLKSPLKYTFIILRNVLVIANTSLFSPFLFFSLTLFFNFCAGIFLGLFQFQVFLWFFFYVKKVCFLWLFLSLVIVVKKFLKINASFSSEIYCMGFLKWWKIDVHRLCILYYAMINMLGDIYGKLKLFLNFRDHQTFINWFGSHELHYHSKC